MNYDFYADSIDSIEILKFIFGETDLHLYDLVSAYGKEIIEYKNVIDVSSQFDLSNKRTGALHFQLWTSRHKGRPIFRRVELDPARCEGYTFRYSTQGWGMIQLYFEGVRKMGLSPSHIGHFEERGAYARDDLFEEMGEAAAWDWAEIRRTSRKLKYHIQKRLSVNKVSSLDSRDILPGAKKLFDAGIPRLHV